MISNWKPEYMAFGHTVYCDWGCSTTSDFASRSCKRRQLRNLRSCWHAQRLGGRSVERGSDQVVDHVVGVGVWKFAKWLSCSFNESIELLWRWTSCYLVVFYILLLFGEGFPYKLPRTQRLVQRRSWTSKKKPWNASWMPSWQRPMGQFSSFYRSWSERLLVALFFFWPRPWRPSRQLKARWKPIPRWGWVIK